MGRHARRRGGSIHVELGLGLAKMVIGRRGERSFSRYARVR
jgi:hypothetical protein